MADPASLGIGVVSAVIQSYNAVTAIYDAYLDFNNFDQDYKEIHMCLMIERCRLDLWASLMQLDHPEPEKSPSARDLLLWKLFKMVFDSILSDLKASHEKVEHLGHMTALATQDELCEYEFIDSLTAPTKEKPRLNGQAAFRKIKFVLRDKQKLKTLVKRLCYLNDSLEKMSSQLEQESLRRKLKTQFTTRNAADMPQIRDAAALLEHKDIQQLASARLVVEQGRSHKNLEFRTDGLTHLQEHIVSVESDAEPPSYQLDLEQLKWRGSQYAQDQPRALAVYRGEEVIVDWRASEDDTWRKNNPKAFRKRTENLTKLLNQDLRPLNLSILHCVGYLNQGKSLTGYAFRLPGYAKDTPMHRTLFDLVSEERDPRDLPDLGDRFALAKALVNTIVEIHSINWLHKNISTKNIIFWSRDSADDESSIIHPYLMGFDVSRPNQPFEVSERPTQRIDDDHYRHPDYREPVDPHQEVAGRTNLPGTEFQWRSFKPSYDIYSLGVVLYEIGIWHNVSQNKRSHPVKPSLQTYNSDPNLIEKCLGQKQLKDLRRHTGRRYSDVVVACLDKGFDRFWDDATEYDPSTQLKRYLRHLQNKVVDPLAVCNA